MTEQLAVHKVLGDGPTVERDERAVAPPGEAVNGTGYDKGSPEQG